MILPDQRIVLGVSGGPDSMALLYLLYDLRADLGCDLHIAHLDHRLRGEESKADAVYVREHAQKLDLPITSEAVDVRSVITSKESLESGARRVRYEFYERVMANTEADRVALGHNADDQAETVIMRLLRGSGARGLGGIPPVRDSKFIRPLIEVSRTEIEDYLQTLHLTPRQDLSNLSIVYRRNKIRHELLPALEREYSPNIKRILQQTGDVLRAEDELLTALAQEAMGDSVEYVNDGAIMIRISSLKEYHLALQRRIFRQIIKELVGDLRRFDYDHIRDLLDLALCGTTGSVINLPRRISAEKVYNGLILRLEGRSEMRMESFDYPVNVPGETEIADLGLSIKTVGPEKARGDYKKSGPNREFLKETLDYDKINGGLHLRNRRPGDRFWPLGMSGMKKLKNFFIDEKVPRASRDSIPVLTDAGNIIWVVGRRIDDRFKITADTKTQLTVIITYHQTLT